MPKFQTGAPQVIFKKRNGAKFTKTYHSRTAAAKSVKAWRAAGGKVLGTDEFVRGSKGLGKSLFGSRSGMTQRTGRGSNKTKRY